MCNHLQLTDYVVSSLHQLTCAYISLFSGKSKTYSRHRKHRSSNNKYFQVHLLSSPTLSGNCEVKKCVGVEGIRKSVRCCLPRTETGVGIALCGRPLPLSVRLVVRPSFVVDLGDDVDYRQMLLSRTPVLYFAKFGLTASCGDWRLGHSSNGERAFSCKTHFFVASIEGKGENH